MKRIDTTILVQTPERVGFRFRVAGPAQRGAAWAVDLLLQIVVMILFWFGLAMVIGTTGSSALNGFGAGVNLVILFVVSWFYAAIFEVMWSGKTPGKAALGLRVVHGDGAPVTVRGAVLRNLLRAVDGLPVGYVMAVIVQAFDSRLRRIGDLVADTVVIVETPAELLSGVAVDPPVTEEERRNLPVKVLLHTHERRAIEALLRRSGRLSKARMEELAGFLAPALCERTGVEAPTALRALTLAYARATDRD